MLKNKNYLFLLLSVPMYVCYLFISSLFDMYDKIPFHWSEVICFSVYVISVTLILTVRTKPVKGAFILALHAVLVLLALFDAGEAHLAKEQWTAYGAFCLPSLVFSQMLLNVQSAFEKEDKRRRKRNSEVLMKAVLSISAGLVLSAAFAMGCFFSSTEPFRVKFGSAGLLLVLFFLFFLYCAIAVSNAKIDAKEKQICVTFSGLLCAMAACSGLIYILFMNYFTIDFVKVVFPLFLSAVLFFEQRPVMKGIIFGKFA